MPPRNRKGRIITFYSYKGGTGRSMALANVAWILASAGKRVLTLDWDLEAPGLHRYFYPFLVDKALTSSDGLIDFVLKFTEAAMDSRKRQLASPEKSADRDSQVVLTTAQKTESQPAFLATTNSPTGKSSIAQSKTDERSGQVSGQANDEDKEWYKPYANILRYASSLNWKFENGGALDFIPAGRQGSSYSTRVNSFNWHTFYDPLKGGTLLEIAKEKMRFEYDYILIDSRTGVSDTSGICTVQMPDILVICFTLNNQSIEGATSVAKSVQSQRARERRSIEIFPVPMRVENAEKIKLQNRNEYAKDKFKLFPNTLPGEKRDKYWGDVPVIYVPYYAYEEILAAFGDNTADKISVLAAAEELTSYITRGEVKKLTPIPESIRVKVLAVYEGGPRATSPAEEQNRFAETVFEGLTAEDKERARRVFMRLVRVAQPNELGGDTLLKVRNRDIEQADSAVLRPLVNGRLLDVEQSDTASSYSVKITSASLLNDWKRLRGWLDEEREFLLWRQRLQAKAEEWERSNRDVSALMNGPFLREAEKWIEEKSLEISNYEKSYIKSSIEERDKVAQKAEQASKYFLGRKVVRWGAAVAGVLLLLALIGGGYLFWRSSRLTDENAARRAREDKANAHNTIGMDEAAKGHFDSALRSFSNAISTAPDYPDGYMNRGNIYRRLGEFDKAIADLNYAIGLNIRNPNPYYFRGLAYRNQGDKDLARADFTECQKLANDRYWILKAQQGLEQLDARISVFVYGPPGPVSEEIIENLRRAFYEATIIRERVRYPRVYVRIQYNSEADDENAQDVKELIADSYARRKKQVEFSLEKNSFSDARITVLLTSDDP